MDRVEARAKLRPGYEYDIWSVTFAQIYEELRDQ
jgi:hypothetical protein